jgi:hypothetical protein
MAALEDIQEAFDFLRSAGLKKVPRPGDVGAQHVYSTVLQHVHPETLSIAAATWCQNPEGGMWMPAAPELLNLCILLEAQQRTEAKEQQRGCRGCGEILDEEGGILTHGSGYRTVVQHCYPRGDGSVVWDAEPYRIGQRLVLCSCTKGEHIHAAQSRANLDSMPKGWRPTLTMQQAGEVYQRVDARTWITGTDSRANPRDRDCRSPFYSYPSPEESLADPYAAAQQRRTMDNAMRGIVPQNAAAYLQQAATAMGAEIPADMIVAGAA